MRHGGACLTSTPATVPSAFQQHITAEPAAVRKWQRAACGSVQESCLRSSPTTNVSSIRPSKDRSSLSRRASVPIRWQARPVSTRCSLAALTSAFAQIGRPRWQAMNEEHRLQQSQVAGQRRVRQTGVTAHVRKVQQTGGAGGQQLEQVRQGVQAIHPRQLAHVPLQDRGNISANHAPVVRPFCVALPPVTAANQSGGEVVFCGVRFWFGNGAANRRFTNLHVCQSVRRRKMETAE